MGGKTRKLRCFAKERLWQDYERNKLNILLGGWTAFVAHPAYYLFCTLVLRGYYDSAFFRFGSALISLPLMFEPLWPQKAKLWLNLYWYVWIILVLPVSFTFIFAMNNLTPMWLVCEVMMIFVALIFTGNFTRVLLVLGVGIPLGYACFNGYTGHVFSWDQKIDTGDHPLWHLLVPLPIAFWCGVVFMFGARKALVALERNQAITALAGSIAHEMRNPLSQIKSSLDGIQKNLPLPSHVASPTIALHRLKKLYQYVGMGESAIKRGLQVIAMILDEVKDKPTDKEKFNYLHAVQTTQKALEEYGYETYSERDKISLDIKSNFIFKGDETLYLFVLFNLIKNALYYFKLDPQAKLTITIDQPYVRVHDTGPGIPAERLPHLFDSFQTSGKQGGTGLGLAYCKRVMQAFGGDITCHSVLGECTEFTLRFPEVTQETWLAYEQDIIARVQPLFKGKRMLIVDDDETLRMGTQAILRNLGMQMDEAENGQVALQKLAKEHYDLIIMDLNMPVLDGYAAAEKIRAGEVPGYEAMPIIAYTTESAYMAQVKTQKVGINHFVSKPCEALVLIQTLEQALLHPAPAYNKHREIASRPLSGKIILVADDSESNREILRYPLQDWGATVLEAEHGEAVLEQLASGIACDAILLDMRMPGLDGREVTQAIRTCTSTYQTIPILAVTAEMDEEGMQAAYLAGINDCISKPVDTNTLYEKLISQLNKAPSSHVKRLTRTEAQAGVSNPATSATHDAELFDRERLNICITRGLFKQGENAAYIRQAKECMATLEASIDDQNFKNMQEALHFLKGSSANIGAVVLSKLIADIEKQTVGDTWPHAAGWFEQIKDAHVQTLSALQTYLN